MPSLAACSVVSAEATMAALGDCFWELGMTEPQG